MSESKKNPNRKAKVQAFKDQQKGNNNQKVERTHLIPLTNWESTEKLELRGDLLEAFEQQMVLQYQALRNAEAAVANAGKEFQKGAHILQMIMQENIKVGKIKLTYTWNDGSDATEQEVKDYENKMNELRELQKKQFEQALKDQNAEKTGLVGPDGSPVGTTQNLDEEIEDEETIGALAAANESAGIAASNADEQ